MDIVNGGQEIPTLIIGAVGQKGKTMPEYIIKVTDQFVEQMKAKGMSDEYELIRCKDCEHRPTRKYEDGREGFNLRFPDSMCPCQCDDPFYNWMPSDNWYCGNAKKKAAREEE
jgi:hypothetical protein